MEQLRDDRSEDQDATGLSGSRPDIMKLTTDLVAAYVVHNSVRSSELPRLIADVHAALVSVGRPAAEASETAKPTPAQIRRSITRDALISFEDGKPYKTLKRHLTKHGLSFDAYRQRYGLPLDYPSTAASYSETRAALARELGLGRRTGGGARRGAGTRVRGKHS